MVINADVEPSFWAIMIKQKDAAPDGWYWGSYSTLPEPPVAAWAIGNPPIIDRSGFTSDMFSGGQIVPEEPNPLWYPTGYIYESDNKIPDVVPPSSEYGSYCINCHASAGDGLTYSSLDNVLGPGLRYKHYGPLKESDAASVNKADFPVLSLEQAWLRSSASSNRAGERSIITYRHFRCRSRHPTPISSNFTTSLEKSLSPMHGSCVSPPKRTTMSFRIIPLSASL